MRRLVVVVALTALTALTARDAWPCSVSKEPSAHVFGPTDKPARGHRPWIRLWNIKPTDKVTLGLAPPCAPNKVCSSDTKPVAIERDGSFVRPKAPLSSNATYILAAGKRRLETFTVVAGDPKTLPAWSGMTKPIVTIAREGLCSPTGPMVKTTVLPTKADLSDAVLLVYTKQPDTKRPLAGLGAIYLLGIGELELHNDLANIWMAKKPARLWTAISDGDGNIGPIVEHAFEMRAQVFGPKDVKDPRGSRPWIRVYGAPGKVAMQTVDAACDPSMVCAQTMSVAFERTGDFLRPINPLSQGTRAQVIAGKSVLADFTVRTGPGKVLPTIPFTLGAAAGSGPASCPTPNMVSPDLATIDTDATVILLYATKPDPAKPLVKLSAILRFDGRWLDFGFPGSCLFKKLPPKLWTILATDDGAIGEPVEHDLTPKKPMGGI